MRKLTISLFIVGLPFLLFSQHFGAAPKDIKPVKQVTEWTTFLADEENPEETIKDAVYIFRKDGKLDKWISNNSSDEIYTYKYDDKNRLDEVIIQNEKLTRKINYTYFEDRRLAEIQEENLDLRTIQYFNKKRKIIEEKTFWKGDMTDGKWETMSRKLYNYNAQDSLFGEMEYSYVGKGKSTSKKTVHHFEKTTNKKTKSEYFNEKGQLEKVVDFQYNNAGKLIKSVTNYPFDKSNKYTEFLYKDGKLWQESTTGKDYKYEKIYKDGRYIRYKEYDGSGKLIWYTDFQYEYY